MPETVIELQTNNLRNICKFFMEKAGKTHFCTFIRLFCTKFFTHLNKTSTVILIRCMLAVSYASFHQRSPDFVITDWIIPILDIDQLDWNYYWMDNYRTNSWWLVSWSTPDSTLVSLEAALDIMVLTYGSLKWGVQWSNIWPLLIYNLTVFACQTSCLTRDKLSKKSKNAKIGNVATRYRRNMDM